MALFFSGCEDSPRTLAGGALGAVGGGAAGVGIAKAFGASNGLAAAVGLMSAAAGGAIGAKVGNSLDKEAKARAAEASSTNRPVSWVDDNDQDWVALPSKQRNSEGRAMKVKVINKTTGKEIIIEN